MLIGRQRLRMGYFLIANLDKSTSTPISRTLPDCAYSKIKATATVDAVMDGDTSADYIRFHSEDFFVLSLIHVTRDH